jgi:hypothetical protein
MPVQVEASHSLALCRADAASPNEGKRRKLPTAQKPPH